MSCEDRNDEASAVKVQRSISAHVIHCIQASTTRGLPSCPIYGILRYRMYSSAASAPDMYTFSSGIQKFRLRIKRVASSARRSESVSRRESWHAAPNRRLQSSIARCFAVHSDSLAVSGLCSAGVNNTVKRTAATRTEIPIIAVPNRDSMLPGQICAAGTLRHGLANELKCEV